MADERGPQNQGLEAQLEDPAHKIRRRTRNMLDLTLGAAWRGYRDLGVRKFMAEPYPNPAQTLQAGRRVILKGLLTAATAAAARVYFGRGKVEEKPKSKLQKETEGRYNFVHPHGDLVWEITERSIAHLPRTGITEDRWKALVRRTHQYVRMNVDPTAKGRGKNARNRIALADMGGGRKMPDSFRDLIGTPPTPTSIGTGLNAYKQYEKHFRSIALRVAATRKMNVGIPDWLLHVIMLETFFDPNGISTAGAAGCVQFMPESQWTEVDTFPFGQARGGIWEEPTEKNADASATRFANNQGLPQFRHVNDPKPRPNDVYENGNGYAIDLRRDPLVSIQGAVEYLCKLRREFSEAQMDPPLPADQRQDALWILALLAYNNGAMRLWKDKQVVHNPYAYMARLNTSYYQKRADKRDGEVANDERETAAYPLRLFGILETVKRIEERYRADPRAFGQPDNTPENPFALYREQPTIELAQCVIDYAPGAGPVTVGEVATHLARTTGGDGNAIRDAIAKLNPAITVPRAHADFDRVILPGQRKTKTFPDNDKRPHREITFRMILNLPPGWAGHLASMSDSHGKKAFATPLQTTIHGK